MNIKFIGAVSCLSCLLPVSLLAGEGDSSKEVVVTPPVEDVYSSRQIQPLFSRYAQTAKKWTLRTSYRTFRDMELQEDDSFDGWLVDMELIVPLADSWQMRLYLPLHTQGDAKIVESGEPVDIEGNGGLLDFPSVTVDYQFKHAQSASDYNMSAYFGLGYRLRYLEETNKVTGSVGRINHQGASVSFGVNMDQQIFQDWTMIGNLGGRYYWQSDDIHPNDGSDQFFLMNASVAFIYAPENAWVYPMVELFYEGSFSAYNSIQVVPQVVVPIGDHVEVNAGVSIGLLDDGPSTDARVQMTLRF